MGRISGIEVQSCTIWVTAKYEDDGEEYEIVFTKTLEDNLNYEVKEVVSIEKLGISLPDDHPIWDEIQDKILTADLEIYQPGSTTPA